MSAATMASKRSLSRFLTSPNNVAHALDWRKSSGRILSLSIDKDSVHLAVASHPESNDGGADDFCTMSSDGSVSLPSIPLKKNKRTLDPAVANELAGIVKDWQVCGLVVSWPVQEEGWVGASCGRVLHTLDQLLAAQDENTTKVFTETRPVCLWNDSHRHFEDDVWGRSAVYCKATDKTVHYASKEQYDAPPTPLAANVWNDFCRAHWPELYVNQEFLNGTGTGKSVEYTTDTEYSSCSVDTAWLDAFEATGAHSKATM